MSVILPPLGGLRAFEAAARHLSVTQAARELHVTPGAVSLRIKELETALGVRLFLRRPRSLALTGEGEAYVAAVRTAFRLIREATAEITARSRRQELTVSCTPSFATQWLVPRLSRFEAVAPGIDLRISATNRLMEFGRDRVDVAIRHGLGVYDGLTAERLIADELVPVCSPDYLRSAPPLAGPGDLAVHQLLHDERRDDWLLWLHAAGAPQVDAGRGPVFTDGNGAVEAAKAGLGIALAREGFVGREIAAGKLVVPIASKVSSDFAYHLVYPPRAEEIPAMAAFRAWILAEAASGPSLSPAEPPPDADGR